MKVVVTGGIGSGKSSVARRLAERLPTFIPLSVDEMVREVYEYPAVKLALQEKFSTSDRVKVSQIVFNDPSLRLWVEKLFTPYVMTQMATKIESVENSIVEFPLLFELGRSDYFDFVITCVAPLHERIMRVQRRDNRTTEDILKIVDAQVHDDVRIPKSDYVVDTDHDPEFVSVTLDEVADIIKLRSSKNLKIGLVAGSFDPITLGHVWIIKRALAIVDRVVVVLGHNPAKKFMFPDSERERLIRETCKELLTGDEMDRIIIDKLPHDELLVSYADKVKAKFIFRGIRNFTDFEYENNFNLVQKKLAPHIDILYLIPPREITEISSSLVKSILELKEWERIALPYVSPSVFKALDASKKASRAIRDGK